MPSPPPHSDAIEALRAYPLLDAIGLRRSRRFAVGATLPGGGLQHASVTPPAPLSTEEEALLAFAAAGINGFCLADLPMRGGDEPQSGGGNVMAALTGRTIASADAVHATSLFVINDEATVMMKRPQDFPIGEIDDLRRMAEAGRLGDIYERSRVPVRAGRTEIPRRVPQMFPFNKWSTNLAGTTYFLPVCDLTAMYINVILSCFDEEMGFMLVDERSRFAPAGVGRFAKSKGGYLDDDPASGKVVPILGLETIIVEFVMAEQAFMAHNLSLVEQAMGLGGWTHFASASDVAWLQALGFTMGSQKASDALNANWLIRLFMTLLGKDMDIPFGVGLSIDGQDILKPYCPPYYDSMEAAVRAFLEHKHAAVWEAKVDAEAVGTWSDPEAVQASIPWFSDRAVQATIDYCEYIHRKYGRFPAYFGPMRTTIAHQAHHLDLDFYDAHFGDGAYTETQRRHDALWHGGAAGG